MMSTEGGGRAQRREDGHRGGRISTEGGGAQMSEHEHIGGRTTTEEGDVHIRGRASTEER